MVNGVLFAKPSPRGRGWSPSEARGPGEARVKVTDYIAQRLAGMGVRQVFMITGGGSMYLNDSLGKHPELKYVCCHHEQACAIAAEGYVRAGGGLAVVNITTGPGGLNTLTGLLGQWTDSVP